MFSVCPFFLLLTQPKINERPLSFVLSIFYMVTLHEQIMRYNEYTIILHCHIKRTWECVQQIIIISTTCIPYPIIFIPNSVRSHRIASHPMLSFTYISVAIVTQKILFHHLVFPFVLGRKERISFTTQIQFRGVLVVQS